MCIRDSDMTALTQIPFRKGGESSTRSAPFDGVRWKVGGTNRRPCLLSVSSRASIIPATSTGNGPGRAVVSFSGFPSAPALHLAFQHHGHPAAVAWRLAQALSHCGEGESFVATFQRCHPEAGVVASIAEAADGDYRYALRLLASAKPAADPARSIEVRCWRRLPDSGNWHARCAPLRLEAFLRRFLPAGLEGECDPDLSAARPAGVPPERPPARG